MYTEQRREKIIRYLNKTGEISVAELAKIFDVSPTTIRSDLSYLEKANKLRRTHGGAILNKKISDFQTIFEKRIINTDKKIAIAKKAVSLVEEKDTLAIDSGTTCYQLCKELSNFHNLNLIINDFEIAKYLSMNTKFKIIFVGGVIHREINSTNGPFAAKVLENINCDKAFISCESFDFPKGFSTFDENQAAYKQMLMNTANMKIMLIDSSKFDRRSSFTFSKPNDFDYVISDKLPKEVEEELSNYTKVI